MGKRGIYKLCDTDIRSALRSHLQAKHAHETETVILDELGICCGQVRLDLVVVNGLLHGYEIKSDRDSLRRLRTQVDFYSRVLDQATLVVGERHFPEATKIVPSWWAILRIETVAHRFSFKMERRGKQNPCKDPRSLVELIWLEDAIALLERHDMARGIRGKPRRIVWDRICEHVTVDEIGKVVRDHLKARSEKIGNP
jgi:hypothetical protein